MTIILDVGVAQPFATVADAVAVMTSLADDYEVILHDAVVVDSGVLIDGGLQVTIRSATAGQPVVWLIHEVAGVNDPLAYGLGVEGSDPSGGLTTVLIEDVFFVVGLVSMTPTYLNPLHHGLEAGRAVQVAGAVLSLSGCGSARLVWGSNPPGPAAPGGWGPCTLFSVRGIGGQLHVNEFLHVGGLVDGVFGVRDGGVHTVETVAFLNLPVSYQMGLIASPNDLAQNFLQFEGVSAAYVSNCLFWGMLNFGLWWWYRTPLPLPVPAFPASGVHAVDCLFASRTSGASAGIVFWADVPSVPQGHQFVLLTERCGFLGPHWSVPTPTFHAVSVLSDLPSPGPGPSAPKVLHCFVYNCVFQRVYRGFRLTGAMTLDLRVYNNTFIWPGGGTRPASVSLEAVYPWSASNAPGIVITNNIFVGGDFPSPFGGLTNSSYVDGVGVDFPFGTAGPVHPLPGVTITNNLFAHHGHAAGKRIANQVGGSVYAEYDAAGPVPNVSPPSAFLTSLPPAYGSSPANLRPQMTSKAVDGSVTISVVSPVPITVVPPSEDIWGAPRAPIADIGALETR